MNSYRTVIINADDFGYNKSVTDTVVSLYQKGLITSTTIMPNMEAFTYAVNEAKKYPELSVGIHLNLTEGEPVLPVNKVKSLIYDKGFLGGFGIRKHIRYRLVKFDEVLAELDAQLSKCIEYDIFPTHIDSHHHIHTIPVIYFAVRRLAKKYGINKIRISRNLYTAKERITFFPSYEKFPVLKFIYKFLFNKFLQLEFSSTDWFGTFDSAVAEDTCEKISDKIWKPLLFNLPKGITEIGCHVGHSCRDEYRVFNNTGFLREIKNLKIKLVGWHEI